MTSDEGGNVPPMRPDIPRLKWGIVLITDVVEGAIIDESKAVYVPSENGIIRVKVPEDAERGQEIAILLRGTLQ